jgi:hypothetical protein
MSQFSSVGLVSNLFGLLTAGFIYLGLSGKDIPLISGPKQATVILFIMGLTMSILAGIRDNSDPGFFENMPRIIMQPLMGLGVLAFVVLLIVLTGVNVPILNTYLNSFKVLAIIIGLKLIILRGYLLFKA